MQENDALFDALRRSAEPAVVDVLEDLVRDGRDEDLARVCRRQVFFGSGLVFPERGCSTTSAARRCCRPWT